MRSARGLIAVLALVAVVVLAVTPFGIGAATVAVVFAVSAPAASRPAHAAPVLLLLLSCAAALLPSRAPPVA